MSGQPLRVGDILHGAQGLFRDMYDCARVEAIGADWLVVRPIRGADEGDPWMASGPDIVNEAEQARDARCEVGCDER